MTRPPHCYALTAFLVTASLVAGCARETSPPREEHSQQVDPQRARLVRFWELVGAGNDARIAGRHADAVDHYRAALAIDPAHGDSLFYLGQSLRREGQHAEALEAWQQLVDGQPNAKRGFTAIGLLLSGAADGAPFDLERARAAFETAFAMNPEESGTLLHLGELAIARGDDRVAADYLEAMVRSNPRSVSAPYLLGFLAWRDGDQTRARAHLADAVTRIAPHRERSASFEGQTRGGGPMVEEHAELQSLLGAFWLDWSQRVGPQASAADLDVERIYHPLREFLAALETSGARAARELRPRPAL